MIIEFGLSDHLAPTGGLQWGGGQKLRMIHRDEIYTFEQEAEELEMLEAELLK